MLRFRPILLMAAAVLVSACASAPPASTLGAPRIYEACMGVELPKAQAKFREEGKPAEDARIFAHLICKMASGMCAEKPTQGKCPDILRSYALVQ